MAMKHTLRLLLLSGLILIGLSKQSFSQVTLPWTEDFENVGPDTTFTTIQFLLNGLSGTGYSWGYSRPNGAEARLRFNAGPGFAKSGNYAATLDDTLSNSTVSQNDLILTVDLSSYVGQGVQLGFSYMSHNEDLGGSDSVWVRSGFTGAWVGIYDLFANRGPDGFYVNVNSINISSPLLASGQMLGNLVQIRFGQEDNGPAVDTAFVDGLSFDDINLSLIPAEDAGVTSVSTVAPTCNLGTEPVDIVITNFGTDTLRTIPVSVSANNGVPINTTISNVAIPPGGTFNFTFTPGLNFSIPGPYTIRAWTRLTNDPNAFNDSSLTTTVNTPSVSVYPYRDDLEGANNWISGGTTPSWDLATPNMPIINSAAGGQNSWVTQLGSGFGRTDGYFDNEQSFVESQTCFDFTGLIAPNVRVSVWWNSEDFFDGAGLQSSIDSGRTWQQVGAVGTGINWYNAAGLFSNPGGQPDGWSGIGAQSSGGWVSAEHPMVNLAGEPDVRFRFVFGSDGSVTDDGFAFDNFTIFETPPLDGSVTVVNTPRNGCNLTANERVSVRVNSLGTAPLANIPLAYQINGTPPIIRETWNGANIAPGTFGNYTFTTNADLSVPGVYTLKVWTEITNDPLNFNDTIEVTIIHNPSVNTYPYFDDFESPITTWFSGGASNSWTLTNPSLSLINRAAGGQGAWITANGQGGNGNGGYNDSEQSFVQAGPCFDLSTVTSPRVRADIWWNTEQGFDGVALQSSTNGGLSWQNVGTVGTGINWYNSSNISGNPGGQPEGWAGRGQTGSGGWVTADHPLTGLAGQTDVRLRFVFGSDGSVRDDGFAFDNFIIYERAPLDAGVDSLISPPPSGCALGSAEAITIRVRNYGTNSIVDIPVAYRINGGPAVLDTIFGANLAPGSGQTFTFTTTADLSALGNYDFELWADVVGDPNFFNDSLTTTISNIPVVTSYPYFEDFENGQGGWITSGPNDPWEFGTPAGTVINFAASGVNSFMTGLSTPYGDGLDGQIESPCFDMSTILFPMIRMDIWWETRSQFNGDGAKMQYSINGGATWRDLGGLDPDWYNAPLVPSLTTGNSVGWMGEIANGDDSGGWLRVETLAPVLSLAPQVKLRILFQSDAFFSGIDGVAIDNIQIINAPFDLRAETLVSPIGGCGLGNAPICFDIFNASANTFNNPTVSYSVNNGPVVSEPYAGAINPADVVQHCFTNSFNFGPPGTYDLAVWVSDPLDTVSKNDTIFRTIVSKSPITTYPYLQTFDDTSFNRATFATNGNPIIDLAMDWENSQEDAPQDWAVWTGVTPSNQGPQGDHTTGNTQYLYVEDSGFDNDSVILVSPCFDISSLTNPQMRVWIFSQSNFAGITLPQTNEYHIDLINNGTIIYDIQPPRQFTGPAWQQDTIDLSPFTGVVGFRFRVNNNNGTIWHDIALDDFEILDVFPNDVGITGIVQPTDGSCGTATDSVFVILRNFGTNPQNNIPIRVDVGGSTVNTTYAGPLGSGEIDTVFVGLANTFAGGNLTVAGYTNLPGDQNRNSDTTTLQLTIVSPPIAPIMASDTLILCTSAASTIPVTNPDPNLNYTWYDANGTIMASGDTITTSVLAKDTTFFIEASTGMNGLKITEVGLGNFPDFLEIQNTSEGIIDATGWVVYVGEDNGTIDRPINTVWNLGTFQPGEVQIRDTDFNSPNYFGVFIRWNQLPSNGWAMIVDAQCNLVDYVVWGHTQLDVADFSPVGIVGCRSGVTLGDYWNGPSITGTGVTTIQRVGSIDNNDGSDWIPAIVSTPGVQNPGLNAGCTSPLTRLVVIVEPTVGVNLTDQFVCGSATLDAGSGFSSYLWNTGSVSQRITLSDTTFAASVTVTNRFGCIETDTAVISASPIPVIDLGPDTAACSGFILDGGNPDCDYIWSTGSTNRIITFNGVPGNNLVWAECTDPSTGCFSRDTLGIFVRPSPDAGLPSILSLCDSGTISVRPAVSMLPLQWSTNQTSPSIDVNTTGVYRVTVTDTVTGCVGIDSVDVTISPSPIVDVGPTDTTVCSGLTLDAGTFPGFVFYDWNNGQVTQQINVTTPGVYTITVTDFNQCKGVDSIDVIFFDPPTADYISVDLGFTFNFTNASVGNGLSYSWDFGDGNTSILENPSHTYQFAGFYVPCLTVTDSCGASNQFCDTINVGLVGIGSHPFEDRVRIFPSPAKDFVKVDVSAFSSELELHMTDLNGKLILSKKVSKSELSEPVRIDLSTYAEGVYIISLRNETGTLTRKVVKE